MVHRVRTNGQQRFRRPGAQLFLRNNAFVPEWMIWRANPARTFAQRTARDEYSKGNVTLFKLGKSVFHDTRVSVIESHCNIGGTNRVRARVQAPGSSHA